jgi:hypothetical protein
MAQMILPGAIECEHETHKLLLAYKPTMQDSLEYLKNLDQKVKGNIEDSKKTLAKIPSDKIGKYGSVEVVEKILQKSLEIKKHNISYIENIEHDFKNQYDEYQTRYAQYPQDVAIYCELELLHAKSDITILMLENSVQDISSQFDGKIMLKIQLAIASAISKEKYDSVLKEIHKYSRAHEKRNQNLEDLDKKILDHLINI